MTQWVCIGCGTARDIEYVAEQIQESRIRVYMLDLSPELLAIAAQRVAALGLEDKIVLVAGDINKVYQDNGQPCHGIDLPLQGEVDIVTCSFCLTMIPGWIEVVESMVGLLREGGTLAVIDFSKDTNQPNRWSQRLNQWWFAHDGVYLNDAQPQALRNHPSLETLWFHEEDSRVPYTPLYATRYTFIGYKIIASS